MSKSRQVVTRTIYDRLLTYQSGLDTTCTRAMSDLGVSLFSRLLHHTGSNYTLEEWIGEGAACETTDE